MLTSRSRSWLLLILIFTGVLVVVLLVSIIQVRRDWGYVCEYTGSRKGHRAWWFGIETKKWYDESPLEVFMERNYPSQVEHKWTSYAGTGRNIFRGALLFGHGRPGPIFDLNQEALAWYSTNSTPVEMRHLYDVMRGDNKVEKQKLVQTVSEAFLQSFEDRTNRGSE